MRVLLTRAAGDAARTRETLEKLGHRVLVSPVIAIEATGAPWPGGIVQALLATSGKAFAAMTSGWGPIPEARRLTPLWLVGQRTEGAARAAGFLGSAYVAPNAVSLAFEIGKRRGRDRLVYLAGCDRKPDIETALSVMDQKFDVIEMYKAIAAHRLDRQAAQAIVDDNIDAVLHFSRRSATIFADLAFTAGLNPRTLHICLSADVAAPLQNKGFHTRAAAEPIESSVIAALSNDTPT